MKVFNYNLVLFVILLSFQIACGQNQNIGKTETDLIFENLQGQGNELIEAMNKGDFNRFVELTHPIAVEKFGGKKKLIAVMKETFDESPKNFKSFSISMENPTDLIKSEGKLFGIIPLKMEGITHANQKIITSDCFVGISSDKGNNWLFISGEGAGEAFPSSKHKLKIIVRKTYINGVEQ